MTDDISQYSKEVAKGSIWSLAGNVSFYLISFFYVILIARSVSQDDLGLFFLAMSVVSLGAMLDNMGLGGALTRYDPFYEGKNEKSKIKSLLKMSYIVVTITALILLAIIWVSADFIGDIYQNERLPEVIRLLSVYLPLN